MQNQRKGSGYCLEIPMNPARPRRASIAALSSKNNMHVHASVNGSPVAMHNSIATANTASSSSALHSKTQGIRKMSAIFLSGSFDLLRDPVKQRHQELSEENDTLLFDYKRLKSYVEQLEREYDESKGLDPIRRYINLKGMIKRTVTYLHVQRAASGVFKGEGIVNMSGSNNDMCMQQGTRNFAQKADLQMKRKEKYKVLNSEELQLEVNKLEEESKEYKRRINMITDLIQDLEEEYANSKHSFPVMRYQRMKGMVKTITHNNLIRDKLHP